MADEPDDANDEANGNGDEEEKSFRERVEEIREQREEEGEDERRERMEEMMGGGPGGPGGRGQESEVGNEELVREVRQLRDEMRDQTRALKRIADALEDN